MTTTRGVFVYGLHKTGTMFLYRFFREFSGMLDLEYFSSNNVPKNHTDLSTDVCHSFCICPIRTYDLNQDAYSNIDVVSHIVQVRDPRDILISQYFSFGWLHPTNTWNEARFKERRRIQSMSIDDYVLEAAIETVCQRPSLARRYEPILGPAREQPGNVVIVRYEDMVNEFESWARRVAEPIGVGVDVVDTLCEKFATSLRINGTRTAHKRNVTPGEHRLKLKPDTIEALNNRFAEILATFRYD